MRSVRGGRLGDTKGSTREKSKSCKNEERKISPSLPPSLPSSLPDPHTPSTRQSFQNCTRAAAAAARKRPALRLSCLSGHLSPEETERPERGRSVVRRRGREGGREGEVGDGCIRATAAAARRPPAPCLWCPWCHPFRGGIGGPGRGRSVGGREGRRGRRMGCVFPVIVLPREGVTDEVEREGEGGREGRRKRHSSRCSFRLSAVALS